MLLSPRNVETNACDPRQRREQQRPSEIEVGSQLTRVLSATVNTPLSVRADAAPFSPADIATSAAYEVSMPAPQMNPPITTCIRFSHP